MFTQGQVARMRSALESNTGDRNNLSSSSNIAATGVDNLQNADFINPKIVCAGEKVNFHDKSILYVLTRQQKYKWFNNIVWLPLIWIDHGL